MAGALVFNNLDRMFLDFVRDYANTPEEPKAAVSAQHRLLAAALGGAGRPG